jgi:UDP-N-acetylmuramoyl-L-alanyl-D-glutamate--2,6-diaminopimelate ligase
VTSVQLQALVPPGARLSGAPETEVRRIDYDSRTVEDGSLFACLPGAVSDGHDHAPAAVGRGAVALLCERPLGLGVPEIVVADSRAALGPLASRFNGEPSRSLTVVGVTGTNGKTTVVHLLRAIAREAGRRAEVVGTLTGARTTPEAPDLQARMAELRDDGVDLLALEVSSHALALRRVDGTWFSAVGFTNLSQDHLDFHPDLEDYFAAKARLFGAGWAGVGVVNVDDPWGARLADEAGVPVVPVRAASVEIDHADARGSRFVWRGQRIDLPLAGAFNVANAVVAAELASALGVDEAAIARGLGRAEPVPGRFELVEAGQRFAVVVDYAHTPDGLERLLQSARAVTSGRLLVVFGCGGDRDRAKRPLMGEVAARLADEVVVTSDNPRHERPEAIVDEILTGTARAEASPASVRTVLDRRAAIADALGRARDDDMVVIAGKGHETTQDIGGQLFDFDDRAVVRSLLDDPTTTGGGAPA